MKVLVTGASGFAGTHLVRHLETLGHQIAGTTLDQPETEVLQRCDVTKPAEVGRLLAKVKPDRVYHLAAPAHVGESFRAPLQSIHAQIAGAVAVLDAAAALEPAPRVLFVSSAEVYGVSSSPLSEHSPLEPSSPYGVGKLAGEAYARYLGRRGLHVVIARPFNHIGPGQSDAFVCSAFAKQIAEAELGRRPPVIEVGNLDAERDFTDVRDTVRAYPLMLERGGPGEAFNVASSHAIPVKALLDGLVRLAHVKLDVRTTAERQRADEPVRRQGDASKLRALGWSPDVPLDRTLQDTLGWWRKKLGDA